MLLNFLQFLKPLDPRCGATYNLLGRCVAGSQVRRALSGFKGLEWHTRTGAPHCLADLESVAAGQATSVILLSPEQEQVRISQ